MNPEEIKEKIGQESLELTQEFINVCNGKSYTVIKIALMLARDQILIKEMLMMQEQTKLADAPVIN